MRGFLLVTLLASLPARPPIGQAHVMSEHLPADKRDEIRAVHAMRVVLDCVKVQGRQHQKIPGDTNGV